MNTRIEVGPMSVSFTVVLCAPSVKTQKISNRINSVEVWTYFGSPAISVNGHSLKSINPEFAKAGELATSLA